MRHRAASKAFSLTLLILLSGALAPALLAEPDAALVNLGRYAYRTYCAACHGQEGRGDGPVAEHLRTPPADLTAIRAQSDGEFPAEQVHRIIDGREPVPGHGSQDMPIWGDAFQKSDEALSEEEIRNKIESLVHFLESIQEP